MKLRGFFVLLVGLLASFSAMSAGDVEAGRAKAAVCAACHGQNGYSQNPMWPKLAGQHSYYTQKQIQDFQTKKRNDPAMSPMAMGLSEIDIENLAAFFASQSASVEAASEENVALGEKVYRGGNAATGVPACIACHGPNGAGNGPARFPRVGGQHAVYLIKSLEDFKSAKRDADPQSMMRDIAAKLTKEEIEAVSSYMSGLH